MGAGWSYYYWPGYYHPYYAYPSPLTYPHPHGIHDRVDSDPYGVPHGKKSKSGVSDEYYNHLYENYNEGEVIGTPVFDGAHNIDEDSFFKMSHLSIAETSTDDLRQMRRVSERHYQRTKENGDDDLAARIKEVSEHISDEILARKIHEEDLGVSIDGDSPEEDVGAEVEHFTEAVYTNHRTADENALKERHQNDVEVLKSLSEASDIHELQENHKVATKPWKRMHVVLFGGGKGGKEKKGAKKVTILTSTVTKTVEYDYTKIMEMHDTLTFYYAITVYLREFVGKAGKNMGHASLMEYHKDQAVFSDSLARDIKCQAYDFIYGMKYFVAFSLRSNPQSDPTQMESICNYFIKAWDTKMSKHLDLERAYIENSVVLNVHGGDQAAGAATRIAETRAALDISTKSIATLLTNLFSGMYQSENVHWSEFATAVYAKILFEWDKHVKATTAYVDLLTKKGFTHTVSDSEKLFLNYLLSGQDLGKYLNALAYHRGGEAVAEGKASTFIEEVGGLPAPPLPPRPQQAEPGAFSYSRRRRRRRRGVYGVNDDEGEY